MTGFSVPSAEDYDSYRLKEHGIHVSVGKIDDIFCGRGISQSIHVLNNCEAQSAILELANQLDHGLVFANLIDFDMLYGHRRNPVGYARALEEADLFFGQLIAAMRGSDILIITADHGNDPTFEGCDHTREYVPILLYGPGLPAKDLGIRKGFYDVAQTLAHLFQISPMPHGQSFVEKNAGNVSEQDPP